MHYVTQIGQGDVNEKRSTTSFVVFLGPCLISWSAKKQAVVSIEYRIQVPINGYGGTVAVELYWLRMLPKGLGIALSHPPTLWCDNLGALSLASNPVFHARIKYVKVDYHFIRER